ncbi:MAG: hypothetical protein V2A34_09090 [Lentisphaerota bacterium]
MKELYLVLTTAEIPMPSYEVILLLCVLTLCLLFRATRIGLLTSFLFTYRWGWLIFEQTFGMQERTFVYGYFVFGFIALILAVFSMWRSYDH